MFIFGLNVTWESAILYMGGLMALSLLFGIDYKLYNPDSGNRWMWRIAITLLSINCLHWLLCYALLTYLPALVYLAPILFIAFLSEVDFKFLNPNSGNR
jgi:hypothetical protein